MLVQATYAEVGLALLISLVPGALLVDLPKGGVRRALGNSCLSRRLRRNRSDKLLQPEPLGTGFAQ